MAESNGPIVRLLCDAGAMIGESPVWQLDQSGAQPSPQPEHGNSLARQSGQDAETSKSALWSPRENAVPGGSPARGSQQDGKTGAATTADVGSVWWTDPVSRRLLHWMDAVPHSTDAGSNGYLESIAMPSSVWSLATLPDGTLAGSLDDRFCSISSTGEITAGPAATVDAGCRFNDMTTDANGGLWVGMMHRGILATRGAIFYAPSLDEPPKRAASGLGVPNGMKLSADGRTLFVVDTLERTLLAYPVDGGSLGEPVILSDFLGLAGKPDGMTLAPDGTFWVAMWGGSSVVQLARDGAYLCRIDVPAPHISSVCLAGPNRLLVTTSRMRLSPQALLDCPSSGGMFEILLDQP